MLMLEIKTFEVELSLNELKKTYFSKKLFVRLMSSK